LNGTELPTGPLSIYIPGHFLRNMAGPFQESDADSITSETTAESEQQETYNCDCILAEDNNFNEEHYTRYLLKWSGYELHRATWEPAENVTSASLFEDWERKKQEEREGLSRPFDLDAWQEDIAKEAAESEARKRRREAKRERKRLVQLASYKVPRDSPNEDDVPSPAKQAYPRKRLKVTPPERKGVVKTVKKSWSLKPRIEDSSSSEGEVHDDTDRQPDAADSELNSLFEEGSQEIYPDLNLSSSTSKQGARGGKETPQKTMARLLLPTSASKSAASVASPTATAKRSTTGVSLFINFNKPKARKERPRVSGETSKDSTEPKFRTLAQRNRFQKYSRNEKAPDINALAMFNPESGEVEPPKAAPARSTAMSGTDDIDIVYRRRNSRPERQRTVTPLARRMAEQQTWDAQARTKTAPALPPDYRRTKTCWHWINGSCTKTADACSFAHHSIPEDEIVPVPVQEQPALASVVSAETTTILPASGQWPSKRDTTCHYCKQLKFLHRDIFTD
jgi:hypothetical protein